MSERNVFFALPHYGSIIPAALPGIMNPFRGYDDGDGKSYWLNTNGASLLAHNFNKLFVCALNMRDARPFTHFAMMHSDIEAVPGWLDILIDEMEEYDAQVMSCVCAIKDPRGVTSTGIMNPEDNSIRRFTMTEIMDMPETFDAAMAGFAGQYLMVNTGLWVCRFDLPWVDEFPGFEVRDAVVKLPRGQQVFEIEGKHPRSQANVLPEDWNASRWFQQHGLKVMATRKVSVVHHGHFGFSNSYKWGDWATDQGDKW